jgi:uncharacterized protein YjbI with pentapeptide repeats
MADETISTNGEPDTKEAEALASALNHSAERVQTLWFSFLTFMLYLAIATGTTTHRMLFLEDPLNLPVLNIKLPLLGFYILTPIIFVVFHFYMLLNLVLLARTARCFEDALVRAFPEDGEAREAFRMRIENTLFVQLLVGGRLEREGLNAKLLSAMALITLALATVAADDSDQVSALSQLADHLAAPRFAGARPRARVDPLAGLSKRLGRASMANGGLVARGAGNGERGGAAMVATFPDERMYVATHTLHGPTYFDLPIGLPLLHDIGWYAWMSPVNTLYLYGEDLIDEAKLTHILETNESSTDEQRWVATLSLVGRDLTGANLSRADIRHDDFSGAILNRTSLNNVWAKRANFSFTRLEGASLNYAQLQGASLFFAQLQGASLRGAYLQGASLNYAQLQGASLGVWLLGARPWLQASSLGGAQLQGASLEGAQLQGASLDVAQLQGASLDGAQLQGASLRDVQLQGASLRGAQLQVASLAPAQLLGVGAFLENVCVWRADSRQAAWKNTRVAHPETGPKADKVSECDWTAASFAALKRLIAEKIPEGGARRAAMKRIEQRLDPTTALDGEDDMAKIWAARERETPTPEVYEKSLAGQWREVGCAAQGAPDVLHALIDRLSSADTPFRLESDAAMALAADFLDEAHCPGAHGLSEADKAMLKKIATPAPPQAPKP